ncbi:hypothetical protein [Rahnella sp. AN3-3W3]|jgi:hypothetical protein|uniref:hypothetical protein n=1 Tax=Rahnella sp. AN3-3W3 TaxID=1610578 RepID=UPI000DD3937F|nr:hypothetical protein [Rahnella sp. AN3-3W3]
MRINKTDVIREQKSFCMQLAGLWNLQLPECEEAKEVARLLGLLAENVLLNGVINWHCSKPLIAWDIAQWWLKAQGLAVKLYGTAGADAVTEVRNDLADRMVVDQFAIVSDANDN